MTAKKYSTVALKSNFRQLVQKSNFNPTPNQQKTEIALKLVGCMVNFYEGIIE